MTPRVRRSICAPLAATLALLLAPWALLAQGPEPVPNRPQGARRIVRVFGFEERAFTTEPVPPHWVRVVHQTGEVERPGFPAWNESGFDDRHSAEGDFSVRLPTRGGSAAMRLAGGVVPATPGADYLVTARVRTEGLVHARAVVTARFLDESLRRIEASQRSTPPLRTGGAWREVGVELWGDHDRAAWIQIDLLLLQPAQRRGFERDGLRPEQEDLDGAAWFDDVAISQLPRIDASTQSPTNVVEAPERPTISIRVRDLTGESLTAHARVVDATGREVDRLVRTLESGAEDFDWTPDLEAYGWRRVEIDARRDEEVVGSAVLDFVWTPSRAAPASEATRHFVLIADGEGPEGLALLPDLARRLGAGAVSLPVLPAGVPADDPDEGVAALEGPVGRLVEAGREVILALTRVPEALAESARIDDDRPSALSFEDRAVREQTIDAALLRFGQRVRRWRLGGFAGDVDAPERPVEALDAYRTALLRLSPDPIVSASWPAEASVEGVGGERRSLCVVAPPWTQPEGPADLVRAWREAGLEDEAVIPRGAEGWSTPRRRAADVARRTALLWEAGAARIGVESPWRWIGRRRPRLSPTPEFGAFRTLIEHMHGRRAIGRLSTADGVVAILLDGARGGAVVAWNDHAQPEDAVVRARMATGDVRAFDLFGNPVEVTRRGEDHTLALTREPVFIEGVDAQLIRFQTTARIEPPFVPSEGARRGLEVVLENPWPRSITGRLRLSGPGHWRINPRVHAFDIRPGESARLPFEASFGVGEEAGPHTVEAAVELDDGRALRLVTLGLPLEIGLPDVELRGGVREIAGPGGRRDLLVVTLITNTGDRPATLTAFAHAPGFARKQAPVSALPPGQTVARRFVFENAENLDGSRIRIGLVEADGVQRLNLTLDAP